MAFLKKNLHLLLLLLFIIQSFFITRSIIHEGHNWGGDFALYISQSIAWQKDELNVLHDANAFSMKHSVEPISPDLYPMGLPLIESLIINPDAKTIPFIELKWLMFGFFIGFILVWYAWVSLSFGKNIALYTSIFFLVDINYIGFLDNVLSDIPYLFFTILAFYLLIKNTKTTLILLGFVIFYATFTRDSGITLLPAMFVYHYFIIKNKKTSFAVYWYALPYLLFALLLIGSKLLFSFNNSSDYLELLKSRFSINYCIENLKSHLTIFSQLLFVQSHVTIVWLLLAVFGMYKYVKQAFYILMYIMGSWFILICWPFPQDFRFFLPIIPFIILFIFLGITDILKLFKTNKFIIVGIFSALLTSHALSSYHLLPNKQKKHENAFAKSNEPLFNFIRTQIPDTCIIGSSKPRVLRLITGKNGIYTNSNHAYSSIAKYHIVSNDSLMLYTRKEIIANFNKNSIIRIY